LSNALPRKPFSIEVFVGLMRKIVTLFLLLHWKSFFFFILGKPTSFLMKILLSVSAGAIYKKSKTVQVLKIKT